MHTLPATEIKRRGVAALVEAVKKGPVHIIKNNHPICVVLSEEDYATLVQSKTSTQSLWDLLNQRPWKGKRNKKDILQQIRDERGDWKA